LGSGIVGKLSGGWRMKFGRVPKLRLSFAYSSGKWGRGGINSTGCGAIRKIRDLKSRLTPMKGYSTFKAVVPELKLYDYPTRVG